MLQRTQDLYAYPARLVFTTDAGSDQALIGYGGLSPTSHVAIGLGLFGEYLLHAFEDGVKLHPRTEWFGNPYRQRLVAEFVVVPDVRPGIAQAMTYVGENYDTAGAFKIGFRRLLNLVVSPTLSFGPITTRAQTCTRLAMLLDVNGTQIPEWRDVDREWIVPGDLLRLAVAGPSFRRLR